MNTHLESFIDTTSLSADDHIHYNHSSVFPYSAIEKSIFVVLKTYANVHRGSGQFSQITTHLYESSRAIILSFLGLSASKYSVIFCNYRRSQMIAKQLDQKDFQLVSASDFGLNLGIHALAIKKKSLHKILSFNTGGGSTKLISEDWVIWADTPDKFEAGTPAIINVIAFAKALSLIQKHAPDIFISEPQQPISASELLFKDEETNGLGGKGLLEELKTTMLGKGTKVPTTKGTIPFTNLDNSASTPAMLPAWNAFRQSWRQSGDSANAIIAEAKSICAKFLDAPQDAYEVLFTSNTTDSINLIAENEALRCDTGIEPVVLSTFLEHSSNDLPWRYAANNEVMRLAIDEHGNFNIEELETLLKAYNQDHIHGPKRITIVTVSGASNVLGYCNDIEAISKITHAYQAKLVVDGAQLVAHKKVSLNTWNVDYFAFSAHKIYAPFGCGVLVSKKGLLNFTGVQLDIIRKSGEENIGGIVAMGKSLTMLSNVGMELIEREEKALTKTLLSKLSTIENLQIHGVQNIDDPDFEHKLGVIPFDIKNTMPSTVGKRLAHEHGIGVRYGCHCAHLTVKKMLHIGPFLEKFQKAIQYTFPKFRFLGVVRVSLGIENTPEDIERLCHALQSIVAKKGEIKENKTTEAEVKQHLKEYIEAVTQEVFTIE